MSESLTTLKMNKTNPVPIYKKYAKTAENNWLDPSSRLKPSDLSKPALNLVADDYPMIIEFNNIQDNTGNIIIHIYIYNYKLIILILILILLLIIIIIISSNTFIS